MKKLFFTLVIASAFLGSKMYAQTTAVITATLTNVLTMVVTSTPVFAFTTATHYSSGMSATGSGSILVSSNFPYDISVQSSSTNLTDPVSTQTIAVSNFTIDASGDGGSSISASALSTSAVQVVNEGTAGILQTVTLAYATSGGSAFLNKAAGSYVATLTFTASVD